MVFAGEEPGRRGHVRENLPPLHAVPELRNHLSGGGLPEDIQMLVRQEVEVVLRPPPFLPRALHLVLYPDDVLA